MAPTLINVTVSLVFWDPFSSFSDFWSKFHPFGAKTTFEQGNAKSRPTLLESCSRNYPLWTRNNLAGFFATEECKFWSFFAHSGRFCFELAFQSKKGSVSWKKSRRSGKVAFFAFLSRKKACEIFPFFYVFHPETLRKPMLLLTFRLTWLF